MKGYFENIAEGDGNADRKLADGGVLGRVREPKDVFVKRMMDNAAADKKKADEIEGKNPAIAEMLRDSAKECMEAALGAM